MEIEKALELAVVSSWEDLVKPSEPCAVHVEYQNISGTPLEWLKVWTVRKGGYFALVCDYLTSISRSHDAFAVRFADPYYSVALAQSLDFIMQNQDQFTRPADRSVHGMIQVGIPNEEQCASAATWRRAVTADLARKGSTPYAKQN